MDVFRGETVNVGEHWLAGERRSKGGAKEEQRRRSVDVVEADMKLAGVGEKDLDDAFRWRP